MNELEQKVKTLEINIDKSLNILQKIETRLIGDIEKESIGLIQEVKIISRDMQEHKADIIKMKSEIETIAQDISTYENFKTDMKTLKEIVDSLNKNKWLIQGGLIVIGIIIGKIDWIWKLLFKG